MDDIRLATSLAGHPKCLKLERKLGAAGCWGLVRLFLWVGDNRPDGDLVGLSNEDIELAVGWTGPLPLVPVLSEVGFLDGEPLGHRIHDWANHQPYVATRPARIERARRMANARWSKTTPEDRAKIGQRLLDARREKQTDKLEATCSERTPSTSDNVLATCSTHVDNVLTTHAPTHARKSKPSAAKTAAPLPVPECELLRPEIWQDFAQHRVNIRRPLNPLSASKIIAQLRKFKAEGHDPNVLLEVAIANDWRAPFPARAPNANGQAKPTGAFHAKPGKYAGPR